jgi:hypothetical protein
MRWPRHVKTANQPRLNDKLTVGRRPRSRTCSAGLGVEQVLCMRWSMGPGYRDRPWPDDGCGLRWFAEAAAGAIRPHR